MTKGDIDGLHFLGRTIKPVALGLSVAMFGIAFINITDTGRVTDHWMTHVLSVSAILAFVGLVSGWVLKNQKLAEIGLLLAAVTSFLRASFIFFSVGWNVSEWMTTACAIVAAGAYLLETTDSRRSATARTRATDRASA